MSTEDSAGAEKPWHRPCSGVEIKSHRQLLVQGTQKEAVRLARNSLHLNPAPIRASKDKRESLLLRTDFCPRVASCWLHAGKRLEKPNDRAGRF